MSDIWPEKEPVRRPTVEECLDEAAMALRYADNPHVTYDERDVNARLATGWALLAIALHKTSQHSTVQPERPAQT
jgi:hypothetical protein